MSIDFDLPKPSASELERDLQLARARGIAARDVDPGPPFASYDPASPMNQTDPGMGNVTFFGMSGRPATSLHDISFIANAIPKDAYPVGTTQVYFGMSRQLTQAECDYLNGVTP